MKGRRGGKQGAGQGIHDWSPQGRHIEIVGERWGCGGGGEERAGRRTREEGPTCIGLMCKLHH